VPRAVRSTVQAVERLTESPSSAVSPQARFSAALRPHFQADMRAVLADVDHTSWTLPSPNSAAAAAAAAAYDHNDAEADAEAEAGGAAAAAGPPSPVLRRPSAAGLDALHLDPPRSHVYARSPINSPPRSPTRRRFDSHARLQPLWGDTHPDPHPPPLSPHVRLLPHSPHSPSLCSEHHTAWSSATTTPTGADRPPPPSTPSRCVAPPHPQPLDVAFTLGDRFWGWGWG
jgi:hypothetical protein